MLTSRKRQLPPARPHSAYLFAAVDRALYRAKAAGRNAVRVAGEAGEPTYAMEVTRPRGIALPHAE